MINRVRSALGRFVAFSVALITVSVFAVSSAAAQGTTGKIQGSVTDQSGQPIARAQVVVVGTAFGAVSDDKGYYFINNVPVGTYSLKAQFIGYAPTQQDGARVLGGQTVTFDFKMAQSTVVIGGLTVTTQAVNALVPRDQVTSKSIVSGQTFQNLPVSNVRSVITLQPGVVESGSGAGVSIRGGRPGEANVYIDGAPVRSVNSGAQGTQIQTNAVEEASVTTGALGVEFGDAQSGVINYTTKSGGEKFAGSASAQTDALNGSTSAGWSRYEGSLGGPVPMLQNLRFFVSGEMDGQVTPFRAAGAQDVASYAIAGVDTVVSVKTSTGSIQQVSVPRYVQYSGSCAAASNFGFACQGARRPMNWGNNINLQGKLSYTYGSGSSISLTGVAAGDQFRNWPGQSIGDPSLYSGQHDWSRSAILNWTHSIFKSADRELSVNVNLSYGSNNSISGPLSTASDLATRNPTGGFEFTPLGFGGYGSFAGDFFNNPDQIIRNIRTNTGERLPLLNRTDLNNAQPYRLNPYGMASGGFATVGSRNGGTLYRESRYHGRAEVDWQANRFHRFKFGVEAQRSDLALWSSNFVSQIFMDAYHTKPVTGGAWAGDRLDLGDVVLDLGIRYDYYNSHALFSNTPASIFTNPAWLPAAQNNDAAYATSLAAVFTPSVGHNALSPRIGVSFPITEQTDFHLSYAHQLQSPDMGTVLSGINNDLSFTNANDSFGRDVGFGKTILFEFGVRHSFNSDFVFDLSAYNKAFEGDLSYRIFNYDDPSNPGRQLTINVLTNGDFGYARGVDLKVDRRVGSWFSTSVAYTFEVARSTGSDPNTYLNTNARSISGVTGSVLPPAEQPRAVNHQREHNIVGSVSLQVPNGWQKGTTVGNIFNGMSAFFTFRAISGLPYTPVENLGAGQQTFGGTSFGLSATQSGDINSQSTPWTKYLDMRINKGLRLGRVDVTAFADVRNLLNWRNILGLFAETNDVTNALNRTNTISPELANIKNEAANNGALRSDGAVVVTGCTSWTSSDAGPVNCVMLGRAEARFGNGDGVYTLAEQTAALNSYYDLFVGGSFRFYDTPRSVRLGFEVNF